MIQDICCQIYIRHLIYHPFKYLFLLSQALRDHPWKNGPWLGHAKDPSLLAMKKWPKSLAGFHEGIDDKTPGMGLHGFLHVCLNLATWNHVVFLTGWNLYMAFYMVFYMVYRKHATWNVVFNDSASCGVLDSRWVASQCAAALGEVTGCGEGHV